VLSPATTTHIRTCPLCEATCGLEIETDGDRVVSIRGDEQDVFSKGFLCPKAYSLKELHGDPDRLRAPLRRRPDGTFEEIGWDQAFAAVEQGLNSVLREHGRDAVAVYLGNPTAHDYAALLYGRAAFRALGSKNIYSASTVDQMPKQVSAGLMFGTALSVPVPDLDRCSYLLMLGANPLVSNGSLMTAPDMRGRIRAIRERGGKVVVIDPRRTRTADESDEHHFIRPGTDAHFLMALVNVILAEGLARPGRLAEHVDGLEKISALAEGFTAERVSEVCGIATEDIHRIARELAMTEPAACYARIGTCTQEFGTTASWLVDVLNVITGNLDRAGGAMFTKAAAGARNASGTPGAGRGVEISRWQSRVRGLPETFGELPVACLAEEIETPGEAQVRALVTHAGNPARSTPNSARLERAFGQLEFMVSIDIYLNETTRHADVILPGSSPLERSHYDIALYQLAVRNIANFSPPIFERSEERPADWQIMLRLAGIFGGQGAEADLEALDSFVARGALAEAAKAGGPVAERDPDDVLAALEPRDGPERLLDLLLRTGPYGDGFDGNGGLTLDKLEENPHGVDLGPLEPRIPEVLRTASGKIELAPPEIAADVGRLRERLVPRNGSIVLIGRRELRSNNSWMHNLNVLVKGKDRCTMHVHPDDAARLGLTDGAPARVRSRVGEVDVPVEITDAIMPGVVSIPHGWGHDAPGTKLSIAVTKPGTNSNALADEDVVEPISGNAVLNGIPVEVAPVGNRADASAAAPAKRQLT
jgi:anaerobic selenocysteine-containing dehydrogenase